MFEISSVDFYDAEASIKDYSKDPNVKRRNNVLNKLIDGGIILDSGCGDGIFLMELMKTERIFGIDISWKRLKKIGKNVACADVSQLPFKSKVFDQVICSEVLEHLDDPKKVVKELGGVLKKNGSLIISVPYKERIRKIMCTHCRKTFFLDGHLHSFDEQGIRNLSEMKIEKESKAISRIVYNPYTEFVPNFLKQILDVIIISILPDSARYLFIKFRKVV